MQQRKYDTVILEIKKNVAWVTLNRQEVHNAFNEVMISELTDIYTGISEDEQIRVAVITGIGKSFCAGADLNWMKKQIDYNFRENVEDALRLAELMYLMYTLPQPSIARINGSTIGGGTGLAAVNDIVIACDRAQFSLSEVKLGLVPACISPYVVRRMGEKNCREYFLTGERLSAGKAMASGLVNYVVSEGELDLVVNQRIEQLLTSGPVALAACKKMIRDVRDMDLQDAKVYTAELLAKLRIGGEGQEGMRAFFEKRKPEWVKVL